MGNIIDIRQTRQDYVDGTFEDAKRIGCDCFQLKYDGWWGQLRVVAGAWELFNKEGRSLKSGILREPITGTFVGEYMFGTNWAQDPSRVEKLFLFDVWGNESQSYEGFSYRDRYGLLRTYLPYLPDWVRIVPVYPMNEFLMRWDTDVRNGPFEGVVFRRRADRVADKLLRMKKDIEATYTCVGFEEGLGKHAGRLGALLCAEKTDSGLSASIGGGFSDAQREEIWANKEKYLGRKFDVVGKGLFPSGLVRHPNFIRWKE